jgi:hypothetical protein
MGYEIEQLRPPVAAIVIGLCVAVLLGPSLLVWIVRAAGFAAGCAPGPELCRGMALGAALRDSLALAWSIGTDLVLLIVLAAIAAVACFATRRPLAGGLSLLFLPILPSLIPMLAVYVSRFDGCDINPDGIGTCVLWGAPMGKAFHTAATVPDLIYGFVPYSFAIALVVGVIGWFLARPKPTLSSRASAHFRRFDYDIPDQ